MAYEIVLTNQAKEQFEHIIRYLLFKLENAQAANNIIKDAEGTKRRLSRVANSLKLCEDAKLRNLGYRTIKFKNHNYFVLYRIENGKVYVDGIYHSRQDYENILR